MKHSKNSNASYVLFSGIIFIVLVVIMFYTFRSTKLFSLKMSENFRGGGHGAGGFSGGGRMGGSPRMAGGGFSGARMSSSPGRGFSAAGYAFPNRGQNIARGAGLAGGAGIMRNQNFSRPQGGMHHRGGRHGNWNKDRRNWNNSYWWGAAPFLGGAYYLNNYLDSDYGDWYPGYSYYPDWGYDQEPNITNIYNIYDKKQTSEEESKKYDW